MKGIGALGICVPHKANPFEYEMKSKDNLPPKMKSSMPTKEFLWYFKDDELKSEAIKFNYNAIKFYFKEVTKEFKHVEMVIKRMSGMPVIKESRIPVTLVISCLLDNMSIEEIAEEYGVNNEDIIDAVEYAIEIIDRPFYEDDED